MHVTKERKIRNASFHTLASGSFKPNGWLYEQMKIQANGLTGHLEEQWKDVGPDNGWLGGNGDSYYLDGLVPPAFIQEDENLIQKAQKWIEWTLNSQRDDGTFGPIKLKQNNNEFSEKDWWQEIIMLKVLIQYKEASEDKRIVPFMQRYFQYFYSTLTAFSLKIEVGATSRACHNMSTRDCRI
ncbi:beta-L-arabinofuranosidase domain-containing protein [Radiobacillus sp. PE A8.2]|uniref:beta-L-arabinofuranosidase domain-containing protein n=1 Tax=Radiobacillus sp. PE A8.2 TaxID=3380349 RepID=UPI00388F3A4F